MHISRRDLREFNSKECHVAEFRNFIWSWVIPMYLINFFIYLSIYPACKCLFSSIYLSWWMCVFIFIYFIYIYDYWCLQASFSFYICVILRTDNIIMSYSFLINSILLFQLFSTFFSCISIFFLSKKASLTCTLRALGNFYSSIFHLFSLLLSYKK